MLRLLDGPFLQATRLHMFATPNQWLFLITDQDQMTDSSLMSLVNDPPDGANIAFLHQWKNAQFSRQSNICQQVSYVTVVSYKNENFSLK